MESIARVENLLPGQVGQFFIIFSFFAALVSAVSYFFASKHELNPDGKSWLRLGRWSFILHALGVLTVFCTLFYIISSHLFEYFYAWRHTSIGLKPQYLFAAFWEGGEGSFLLWIFWQAILGVILIFTSKSWESRTMFIVALVQAILTTFIMGIYLVDDVKIGTSPFVLIKHELEGPIFAMENYLSQIKDGNGLNVLLQNYWMVIHPPVLFLGFALTLFPFAYAVAALWKGEYKTFVKPLLRWSVLAAGVLGLGIMMGAAWAYESLTFGGYWAWDPVENASLVPWIILVSALHTLLIYKSTGRSLKITLIFFVLSFLFVWYSTFLTRTGVLGETSVHSFTGEGAFLYWHLIVVLSIFLLIPLIQLIRKWKKMPFVAGEEEVSSREFWLLIGSIWLLLAAMQIIFSTSLPVWAPAYKELTGIDIAPPANVVEFYNNIQVWAAFVILILSGFVQFLKYKRTGKDSMFKAIGFISIISLVLTAALVYFQDIQHIQYILFAFAVVFSLVSNLHYLVKAQKFTIKKAGGSVTHLGFAIMLLGVLISGYNKRVISLDRTNTFIDFNKETFEENLKESRENVLIFRNTSVPMAEYSVTYLGDSTVNTAPPLTYFKVRYEKRDPETNEIKEEFTLYPDAYKKELSANPDSRHYLSHDVFTYITSFAEPSTTNPDSLVYKPYTVRKGDTIYIANGFLVYDEINATPKYNKNVTIESGALYAEPKLTALNLDRKMGDVAPVYVIKEDMIYSIPDTFRDLGLYVKINKINPNEETIEFGVHQIGQVDDYIVMKAIIFPWVNLVWLGIIIMTLGFFITFVYRRK